MDGIRWVVPSALAGRIRPLSGPPDFGEPPTQVGG
jgi:hypothetical protein